MDNDYFYKLESTCTKCETRASLRVINELDTDVLYGFYGQLDDEVNAQTGTYVVPETGEQIDCHHTTIEDGQYLHTINWGMTYYEYRNCDGCAAKRILNVDLFGLYLPGANDQTLLGMFCNPLNPNEYPSCYQIAKEAL